MQEFCTTGQAVPIFHLKRAHFVVPDITASFLIILNVIGIPLALSLDVSNLLQR